MNRRNAYRMLMKTEKVIKGDEVYMYPWGWIKSNNWKKICGNGKQNYFFKYRRLIERD